jgi:isoquinoline 1-oxidoreductase subunit beta
MSKTDQTKLSRREFVIVSGAAGGLALGFDLPDAFAQKAAAPSTEVNAWVVVKPDDTCVIRVVRSEMGQGTITGLAQLVAEELECDWKKVRYEYPTPAAAVAFARRRTMSVAAVLLPA